jgi:ABC-type multidrug transport system ATPase subunit
MLVASAISKTFRGRRVLDALELTCAAGEVAVVLGENGSGKSTLLRVLCGMIEPDAGTVRIHGHVLGGGGVEARRHLGYAPDGTDALPELSLREYVSLVRALRQLPADEAAERELLDWRERLGLRAAWHQRLNTLSYGQRKRAGLLAALLGNPWLLILDEPSNGLDAEGVSLLCELCEQRRRAARATLLASNDLPFVTRLGARLQRLRQGKLHAEP